MVRPAGMGPTMSVRTASPAATVTNDACAGTSPGSVTVCSPAWQPRVDEHQGSAARLGRGEGRAPPRDDLDVRRLVQVQVHGARLGVVRDGQPSLRFASPVRAPRT